MTNLDARLKDLGIDLRTPLPPAANYLPFTQVGDLVFVSGQVSKADDNLVTGKLGADLTIEQGVAAARICAENLLAQAKVACDGDFSKLLRLVKLTGFVNSTADFAQQPTVINGASDFFVEVMGDAGRHSRSAVSAASLPRNVAVEIEAIFQVASSGQEVE